MRQPNSHRHILTSPYLAVCTALTVCLGLCLNGPVVKASGPYGASGLDVIQEAAFGFGPPNLLKRWKKEPAKTVNSPEVSNDSPSAPAAAPAPVVTFSQPGTPGSAKPVHRTPGTAPRTNNSQVMQELQKLYEKDGMPMPEQYVVPVRPNSQQPAQQKVVRRADGSIIVPPQENQFTSFLKKLNPFDRDSKQKQDTPSEQSQAPVVSAPPAVQPPQLIAPPVQPPQLVAQPVAPQAPAQPDVVLFDFDASPVVQKAEPKPQAAPVTTTQVDQLPVLTFDFDSESAPADAKPTYGFESEAKPQTIAEQKPEPVQKPVKNIQTAQQKPAVNDEVAELPKPQRKQNAFAQFPVSESDQTVAESKSAPAADALFPQFPAESTPTATSSPKFPNTQAGQMATKSDEPAELIQQPAPLKLPIDNTPKFPVAETQTEPDVEIVPGKDVRPFEIAMPQEPKALQPDATANQFPQVAESTPPIEQPVDPKAPAVLKSADPSKPPVPNPARDHFESEPKVVKSSPFIAPEPVVTEAVSTPKTPKLISDVADASVSPAKPLTVTQQEVESVVESVSRPQFEESADGFEQPFMQPVQQPATAHALPQPKVAVPQSTDGWKPRHKSTPVSSLSEDHVPVMTASLKPALQEPVSVKTVSQPKPAKRDPNQQKYELIRDRKGLDGLKGFCPVALRENRELVDSSNKYMTVYRGTVYKLCSAEALERFEADPEEYAPAFAGYDVVALYDNQHIKGKLDYALWYNSKLFLFGSNESVSRFRDDPSKYIPEE